MIPLLDAQTSRLSELATELGCERYGQLLTPRRRHSNWGGLYAIDNCAFSGFDRQQFSALLQREKENRDRCVFVAAPDVVGSARRTAETFSYWYPKLAGWPVAMVAQDGVEDLEIPWHLLAAIFIGGSTAWKLSASAEAVIRCAQLQDKWVHVGRINTAARWEKFADMGCDSCDGSGLARVGGSFPGERKKIAAAMETKNALFSPKVDSLTVERGRT